MSTDIREIKKTIDDMKEWYNDGATLIMQLNKTRDLYRNEAEELKSIQEKGDIEALETYLKEKRIIKNENGIYQKEYDQRVYENLSEGIRLLEELREQITGETIFYVVTEQKETNEITSLLKDFREKLVVGNSKILFSQKNEVSETNFSNIYKKINKGIDDISKEEEDLKKLKEYQQTIKDKLINYETILSSQNETKFATFYKHGEKTSQDKNFINEILAERRRRHQSQPFIKYNSYKERLQQWAFESTKTKDKIISMIQNDKYIGVRQKDFKEAGTYTFYTINGYSLISNQGQIFEGFLRGADTLGTGIDTIMEESKGHTAYFQGPDVYMNLLSTSIAIQAKAADASIKGATTYNEIGKIVKEWEPLKTEDDYLLFFLKHFFELKDENQKVITKINEFIVKNIDKYLNAEMVEKIKDTAQHLSIDINKK